LGKVRETGIGMAKGLSGVRAVASPVFDHRQNCIAALSLVGPASRFDVEKMSMPVLTAANKLSVLLGGKPLETERARNGPMEPEN
jgi:IclR family transcriptional regulator, KDG regulon repressor